MLSCEFRRLAGRAKSIFYKGELVMKKILAILLIFIMVFPLFGFTANTPQSNISNQKVISESEKQNRIAIKNGEIKRAIEYGIVPAEIQSKLTERITFKQYCTMLQKAIAIFDSSKVNKWNEIAKLALKSNNKMLREDGMLALYYAADVLGVGDISNYNWDRRNELIGDPWDEISFKYPLFPKWEDIAPFENQGWNYIGSAYFYSMGRVSLCSGNTLFDFDEVKKSMRPADPFTREEAILSAVRLMESITVYAPMEKAAVNTISQETIEKAKQMPAVSPQNLPKWYGYSYALWDNPTCYNWRYFSENTIKQLDDIGFNFLRMCYHLDELFKKDGDKYIVNLTTFENLDDIISWCAKYNMHVTVQLHQIPGIYSNGVTESEFDILENPKHYQQALEIYDFISKRYANVPANVLSFTLLSEPSTNYFTFETHAKLVQDLAGTIRRNDPDRLIMAAALMGDNPDHWTEACCFQPNYLIDNSIVQVESFYPWHNLRRSAFTSLMNGWPYDEAVVVNNMILGDNKPLTLLGDFKAGSEVTYYITGVNNMGKGKYVICKLDGKEAGRYELSGFKEGKDNCNKIFTDENGFTVVNFGDNGNYNGLEITFKIPQDTSKIELFAKGTDAMYVTLSDIMLKIPSANVNSYVVIDNKFQPTGINYQKGKFTSVLIHCSEIWDNNSSTVTVNSDGTYTCAEKYERDVFDLNSMRKYFDKWEAWSKQTGGKYFDFEFCSTFSMPKEIRTAYMRSIMEVFKEYNISWVFSADMSQCGGIIVYKGAEDMSEYPTAEARCILPADGSYSINTKYDYPCYYDDSVISVMQEFMK